MRASDLEPLTEYPGSKPEDELAQDLVRGLHRLTAVEKRLNELLEIMQENEADWYA